MGHLSRQKKLLPLLIVVAALSVNCRVLLAQGNVSTRFDPLNKARESHPSSSDKQHIVYQDNADAGAPAGEPAQGKEDGDRSPIYDCYVKWLCWDGTTNVFDSAWAAPGSDENKTVAEGMARDNCQFEDNCTEPEHTQLCCLDAIPEHPFEPDDAPYCDEIETVEKSVVIRGRKVSFRVPATRRYICRFSGIANNGNPIGATSRPSPSKRAAREDAWRDFAPRVTQNEGLLPGSLQVRTENAFFFRCYVRVVSENHRTRTLFDQQVEASGRTGEQATSEAVGAAYKLAYLLEVNGHRNVRVVPVRCDRILNTLRNVCAETALCRHECTAVDGWTIVAARRGRTRQSACSEAHGAATVLADEHEGVVPGSCRDLPTVRSHIENRARGGCASCGN